MKSALSEGTGESPLASYLLSWMVCNASLEPLLFCSGGAKWTSIKLLLEDKEGRTCCRPGGRALYSSLTYPVRSRAGWNQLLAQGRKRWGPLQTKELQNWKRCQQAPEVGDKIPRGKMDPKNTEAHFYKR